MKKCIRGRSRDIMKVLITGGSGQLGYDVIKVFKEKDIEIVYPTSIEMDITDKDNVNKVVQDYKPDLVIHCAAWTDVDKAEMLENKDLVRKINVEGTKNIALACKMVDAKMIYISTDYVFDGKGDVPFDEESKSLEPLNYYGKTKLEGEYIVKDILSKYFIVRTSWVYGINGNNFVKTMIKLSKKYKEIRVVNDQIGSPTYTLDLANFLYEISLSDKYGIYHATNSGSYISWYDFSKEIFKKIKSDIKVNPVTTLEYGSKTLRPYNSRLDKKKILNNGFNELPSWEDALERFIKVLEESGELDG